MIKNKEKVKFFDLGELQKKKAIREVISYEKKQTNRNNPLMVRCEEYVKGMLKQKGFEFKISEINGEKGVVYLKDLKIPHYVLKDMLSGIEKEVFAFMQSSNTIEMTTQIDNNVLSPNVIQLRLEKDLANIIFFFFKKERARSMLQEEIKFIVKYDKEIETQAKYAFIELLYDDVNTNKLVSDEFVQEVIDDVYTVACQYIKQIETQFEEKMREIMKKVTNLFREATVEKNIEEFYQSLLEKDSESWSNKYWFSEQGELVVLS